MWVGFGHAVGNVPLNVDGLILVLCTYKYANSGRVISPVALFTGGMDPH